MKHKVIAIALSTVLALSSTSAFAAEVNTKKVNFDYSSLAKNYYNCPNKDNTNILSKITINGKSIDLKSIDCKSIIKKYKKTPVAATPAVTKPVVKAPVVTKPVVTAPVVTKPVVTAPVVSAPATTAPEVTKPVTNEPVNDSTKKDSTSNSSVSSSNLTYEQKVVELVNVERQKNGLAALALDSSVSNVARTIEGYGIK